MIWYSILTFTNFVNEDNGDKSLISLYEISNVSRLFAYSNPFRLEIREELTFNSVNFNKSPSVISVVARFNWLMIADFKIEGYIDKNADLLKNSFAGKPVILPQKLQNREKICVLICTIRPTTIKQIQQMCKEKEIECYPIDEVILKLHRKEVMQCFDLLEDEQSKKIYAELTEARITGQNIGDEIQSYPAYFSLPIFKKEDQKEVFVDCGAYDGDSIGEYLKQKNAVFDKIIAFEPDTENFKKLQRTIENECEKWNISQEKFEIYPYAIGEKSSVGKFERYEGNNGIASKMLDASSEQGEECKVVSLDEFLTEPYSFLKADIESFEYKMLLGAKESIKKNKPLLAICIYHNAVDFYSIPLLIKEILPEYKIAIRHHLDDTSETVVYAWVE